MAVEYDLDGYGTPGTRLSPDAARLHHPAGLAGAAARLVREKKGVPASAGARIMHGVSPRQGPDALFVPTRDVHGSLARSTFRFLDGSEDRVGCHIALPRKTPGALARTVVGGV